MALFIFSPFKGASDIQFGDNRDKVRQLGTFEEFKKNRFSKNTTDDFGSFHVYYDESNNVEAIEFFPDSILMFNRKNLFMLNPQELTKTLNDSSAVIEESDISFPSYGMDVSFDGDAIISILIHKEAY